ncbi:MAG TPA: ATP-binding protein, partial [Polyangiales bacterium]|nr:ATP-binding protein [Polyangiales bacterium]
NPYVGCAFGCTYCYARYAHRYAMMRGVDGGRLDDGLAASVEQMPPWLAFERRILVKRNLPDVLARTLRYAIAREKQAQLYRDTLQRLARAEKLEAVGRLAAGVVHDFNNLLTVVQTHASLLRRSEDSHVREHAQAIHSAVQHAAGLTDQLLAFCRGRPHRRTTIDLSNLVTSMVPMLRRLIGEDIHLAVNAPGEPVHVIADRGQVEQVVLNLVINARDAVGGHGAISIRTQSCGPDVEGGLQGRPSGLLSVSDDGPGMDDATKARIFEPFFTTKDYGHGLGLATVFGVVQQCNGNVTVSTAPNAGTEFRVFLPAPPSSSTRFPATKPPSAHPDPRDRRVLLIEDDDMLRDVVCVALQQVGYEVLAARDGVEALAIAKTRGSEIHYIITDISLPGPSGTQLAAGLCQHCPGAPILFVSGWAGPDPSLPQLEVPTAFLPKPFSSRDLLRALDRLSHVRN